jgi:tetratricopeptide (TPR) repeat protein
MQRPDSPYDAVFHFRDARLFEAFMADIPEAPLRERLRRNTSLRNRTFPGFRVTKALPTDRQISTAFKREIVDRSNGDLAYFLCTLWIREHSTLAKDALALLGIQAKTPENAHSWIDAVHGALDQSSWEIQIRSVVRALGDRYPNEQIQIFISIISYGKDQEYLRQAVLNELNGVAADPALRQQKISEAREAARADIQRLEALKSQLQHESDDEQRQAEAELNNLNREHERISSSITQCGKSIETLSSELDRIKEEKNRMKEEYDTLSKSFKSVARAISARNERLSSQQTSIQARIQAAEESISTQSCRIVELDEQLAAFEKAQQEKAKAELAVPTPLSPSAPIAIMADLKSGPTAASTLEMRPDEVPPLGSNAICYQGIQRIFRNAVVVFLRDRITRVFPQDFSNRLKKPFGDEWTKAESNANLSRANLGTTTTIRDDFDLLGTNHFYNLFDIYFDKLFTPDAGHRANTPKPVKARFMGNLKAIKDCRDPLSHPVEEEVPIQEAQHLLYCAQEILRWIDCADEAKELAALADQLNGTGADEQSQLRRLPSEDSIYLEFVGRGSLLRDLTECFANPLNKRCLLAGDGGKGKSAAAFRFVQNLPPSIGQYPLILWLSAKKKRFSEGVTTKIETPDFGTVDEAVDRILNEYGATSEDLAKDFGSKKRLLFEYLDDFPAFIVADDIDSVLEDDDVVGLFTHEIPHTRSTVLMTSRRSIPGIRTFTVPGFDQSEAEEFIKSRIRIYGLDKASFSGPVIKKIVICTDGSPLYMDDLLRLAKILDVNQAISIWTEKGGDEARKYALQREVEKLSLDGRKVLVAAAVQDEPISFAELKDILEFSEERLLSALIELQTLFLFPKAPAVEGEQRYQINLNTKKLVRFVEGSNEFYARIENRGKALAGKLPTLQHGLVASLIRQAMLRFNAGQHGEAETILMGAIEKYPNAADLHGVLGFMYRRMGRVADATAHFEAAYKLKSKNPETYLHWMKMEISEKEWSKAISVADRALKLVPDAYEIVERKVYALRQAGFDLHRGLHSEKAAKMWIEAVEEIDKSIKSPETLPAGARALNASMYYTIVVCLDMLNQFRERNRWLERWDREHPDDPMVAVEKDYLIKKRGNLSAGFR